jgi:hypothetical protein
VNIQIDIIVFGGAVSKRARKLTVSVPGGSTESTRTSTLF